MNILVTGGCGYVGSVLVNDLLLLGHKVTVIDSQWFRNYLMFHPNLSVSKKLFSEISYNDLSGIETVIHLALS